MKALLHQFWQKFAHGLERDADVGTMFESAAIMQAENRARHRAADQAGRRQRASAVSSLAQWCSTSRR